MVSLGVPTLLVGGVRTSAGSGAELNSVRCVFIPRLRNVAGKGAFPVNTGATVVRLSELRETRHTDAVCTNQSLRSNLCRATGSCRGSRRDGCCFNRLILET